MCHQYGFPISDFLNVFGSEQVGQQLRDEVDGDKQCDLFQRYLIGFAECHKKKGRKINDDCLRYISDKAGEYRMFVCQFFHGMVQPF